MAKRKPVSVPEAIRASLLEAGTTLEEQGKLHQALTPYLELVESHPDSEQATIAAQRALGIAEILRDKGQHHVSMAVLDRLEKAYQAGQEREEWLTRSPRASL